MIAEVRAERAKVPQAIYNVMAGINNKYKNVEVKEITLSDNNMLFCKDILIEFEGKLRFLKSEFFGSPRVISCRVSILSL